MHKLADLIETELQNQEICAVYNSHLERVWPRSMSLSKRKQQIKSFAKQHELAVTFYDVGLCAIFEKPNAFSSDANRVLVLDGHDGSEARPERGGHVVVVGHDGEHDGHVVGVARVGAGPLLRKRRHDLAGAADADQHRPGLRHQLALQNGGRRGLVGRHLHLLRHDQQHVEPVALAGYAAALRDAARVAGDTLETWHTPTWMMLRLLAVCVLSNT